jgi:hypothetical protein
VHGRKIPQITRTLPRTAGHQQPRTDTSKNALNSTGLLRHSTPITALKHYTRAQKASIEAALKAVEQMATKAPQDTEVEVV